MPRRGGRGRGRGGPDTLPIAQAYSRRAGRASIRTAPIPLPPGFFEPGVPIHGDARGGDLRAFQVTVRGQTPAPPGNLALAAAYQRDLAAFDTAFIQRRAYFRQLYDTLLRMPIGYRTNVPNHWFDGIPLGVLVQTLVTFAGGDRNFLSGFYITGTFINFSQRVQVVPDPTRGYNELTGAPLQTYRATNQTGDLFINRVPLITIQPIQPMNRANPGDPLFHSSGLDELLEATRSSPGGSNFDCLVGFQQVWIERLHAGRVGPMPARVLPIRTAGFGQLITRELVFTINGPISPENGSPLQSYLIYVPDGQANCFMKTIERGFIEASLLFHQNLVFASLAQPLSLETFDATAIPIAPNAEELRILFQQTWTEILNVRARAKKLTRRQYQMKYFAGFPFKELRRIAMDLFESPLRTRISVWVERKHGDCFQWTDMMGMPPPISGQNQVDLMIMMLNGKMSSSRQPEIESAFTRLSAQNGNEDECGTFVDFGHAVLIHPQHLFPRDLTHSLPMKAKLRDLMEQQTVPFVQQLAQDSLFNPNFRFDDFARLVQFQMKRHQLSLTSTSIFHPVHPMKELQPPNPSRKRKIAAHLPQKPTHFVYAWDLETVENKQAVPITDFSHSNPPTPLPIYKVEAQIPWSAQWVCVNVSDPPNTLFTQTKLQEGVQMIYYESLHPDPAMQSFLLGEVHTEYGDYQLGRCVEDMLKNIAIDCFERGGKMAFIWAHNAHHFDHYVLLHHCRYRHYQAPLKTNRGLLTLFLEVPIMTFDAFHNLVPAQQKNIPTIRIQCMDTYLHFSQKLSALCQCFQVPDALKKIDFPITRVNQKNCYRSEILELTRPYGENDVLCLAWILNRMNFIYADSKWKPANPYSRYPPVCQFTTAMSIVKRSTKNHFANQSPEFPMAVDIPALRQFISAAVIGGRVNAYAKTYASPFSPSILEHYLKQDITSLKTIHRTMWEEKKQCMMVLDVTSLYPYAQSQYPMPTGKLRFAGPGECEAAIDEMHCPRCLSQFHECDPIAHSYPDFHIIFVTDLKPPTDRFTYRNVLGRKIFHEESQKVLDLVYSLESDDEIKKRLPPCHGTRPLQAFSNVDLYWFKHAGWSFTILCGVAWRSSRIYHSMLCPAFQQRIEAKKAGNDVLSEFLKLLYNGTYGVTAEKEIKSNHIIITLPEDLWERHLSPLDPTMMTFIRTYLEQHKESHADLVDTIICDDAVFLPSFQVLIKVKKRIESANFFSALSPNHIGAAVLAYARHVMNLIMFGFPVEDISYTDTDSLAIAAHHLDALKHLINNAADAPLGSLKNDHLKLKDGRKNGNFPVVFLSLIGTKKVKCHFTLNENGELHIFNTFKGFQPSLITPDLQRTHHAEYAPHLVSKTLLSIATHGTSQPAYVRHWSRSLQIGITIENPNLQSFDTTTYLGHCQGTSLVTRPHGTMEMFIPFGSEMAIDFPFEPICPGSPIFQPPAHRFQAFPFIYGCSPDLIGQVIDQYYTHANEWEGIHNEEMRTIHAIFDACEDELE